MSAISNRNDSAGTRTSLTSVAEKEGVATATLDLRVELDAHQTQLSKDSPAVIILNLFCTGLAIARNLRRYGVRVIGLSADAKAYGRFSRFCEVRTAPNSQEQAKELSEFLLRASGELQGAIIFPTRDADVLFLDRFREELQPHYRLAIPSRECLGKVIDKSLLAQTAVRAGVPVPRTMVVRSREDIVSMGKNVGFPCVGKPVRSVNWRSGNNWAKLGARKAFLAQNLDQLQQEYTRIAAVDPELLVQEWIPGPTSQIVILGGYVGENGEPLAHFTARKLVQSPDDFGTGCIVESTSLPELLRPTIRLWRALNFRGMAEVEYKRDPRTGEYKLIEINARHWDWHELGIASDINLSWVGYCHLANRPVAPLHLPIRKAKWVAEDAVFHYFLQRVYGRRLNVRDLVRLLSGRRQYGIFAWNDPLPFLHCFFLLVLPTVGRQVWSKLAIRRGN